MHCGISIRHPEAARFFTPVYRDLIDRGHDVSVFVREHTHATQLLRAAGVTHEVLAAEPDSRADLLAGHLAYEARLLAAARRRDVDVLTAIGGTAITHLAPLAGARSVAFVDWERAGLGDALVAALADAVCTPQFVASSYGPNHRRYAGYHELAYLRPDRFAPSRAAVSALGIDPGARYFVASFLDADGDWWDAGDVAARLDDCGDLYLAPESDDPDGDLASLPLAEALDALAYADLYVGDSASAAVEAALLGTPAVLLAPSDARIARCAHLAEQYGLLATPTDGAALRDRLAGLLDDPGPVATRRETLLAETVDVAGVATDMLIETADQESPAPSQ